MGYGLSETYGLCSANHAGKWKNLSGIGEYGLTQGARHDISSQNTLKLIKKWSILLVHILRPNIQQLSYLFLLYLAQTDSFIIVFIDMPDVLRIDRGLLHNWC